VDTTVEIRYAGVVVGRSTAVRDLDEAGGFITFSEPLPVGTPLSLKVGDAFKEARVVEVMESADPAAGMRVRFGAHAAAGTPGNGKPHTDGVPERTAEEGSDSVASEPGATQADGGGGGGRRRRKRR